MGSTVSRRPNLFYVVWLEWREEAPDRHTECAEVRYRLRSLVVEKPFKSGGELFFGDEFLGGSGARRGIVVSVAVEQKLCSIDEYLSARLTRMDRDELDLRHLVVIQINVHAITLLDGPGGMSTKLW